VKEAAASLNTLVEVEGLEEVAPIASEFKVAIDLETVLNNKGTALDMFLKPGDVLNIPSKLQTVKVIGMVLKPSLVPYKEGLSLRKYIFKSGGFSKTAKTNKIYVSYANGDIKTTKRFLFINRYPKLEPGAVIFVPEKAVKEKMSTAELLGITSSIATLGILIQTILN
jgi:protein involved in polysaccharide export with SLBB domain